MDQNKFDNAVKTTQALCQGLERVIKGRGDTIKLLITALVADGHVLLEDYPGSGKTTLTKALGKLIAKDNAAAQDEHILPFRRIQFTPDMLPGDVIGVTVFDAKSSRFHFVYGPVFAHIVLADELNRTGPKVQAAFLECMAEKQVTVDNVTYPLDDLFFVVGTQNPLDVAGTYPLPLVQLDRFLLRVPMSYVDRESELHILEHHNEMVDSAAALTPVCTRGEVLAARAAAKEVELHPVIRACIVDIVQATRDNPLLQYGASTRAALALQSVARAHALLSGRSYTTEDDLKLTAPYVLLHRLKFHAGAGGAERALEELMAPHIEKLVAGGA
jgi:MoxR-like ATPase